MNTITDKPIVVILGGNILNFGVYEYCKNKGYNTVVVDWSPNANLKGDLFLCIDVKDYQAIIAALRDHNITDIAGAYTSIDLAVRSVNMINRHYGLSSMPDAALDNCLQKAQMTRIWQENNLLNRYSQLFENYDSEIEKLAEEKKIILKPNISASSRGITIIDKGGDVNTLANAFEKAKRESYDKKVIVEEYVEGQEFTCEMLGDHEGNVSVYAISVKYHTENTTNNKIAVKLHYNSNIYPDSIYEKIAETGKACYRSLGFKSCFGHLEILMKPDGTLSPVEIGARSSGYIANPLVTLASQHDFFGGYLSMLSGEKLPPRDYINGSGSSMYFFYDIPYDTEVVHPCSLMEFLPYGVVSSYHNRSKLMTNGYRFSQITNDNERIGYEIISGSRDLMSIGTICQAETKFISKLTGK